MKKLAIMVIALALLTGFAVADRGINQTPETQGIVTATTIDAVGNFASTTDVSWRQTNDDEGLGAVPDLANGNTYYTSVYTEDTQSNGEGVIQYDKSMALETSARTRGQSNIEATKQLNFLGLDGANRVYSTDYIMMDGVGNYTNAANSMLCIFAADGVDTAPGYCNFVEAGSTVDMYVANVRTTSSDRFVVPSSDTPVELAHSIAVTPYADEIPSMGVASAHMAAVIMEAYSFGNTDPDTMGEQISFAETTSVYGAISTLIKDMSYNSGMRR